MLQRPLNVLLQNPQPNVVIEHVSLSKGLHFDKLIKLRFSIIELIFAYGGYSPPFGYSIT